MTTNDQLLGLVTIFGSMVLASRAYRSRQVPWQKSFLMAVIWIAIIGGLAMLFRALGAHAAAS